MSEVITISSDNEDYSAETLKKSCSSKEFMLHKDRNGNKSPSPEQDVSCYSGFQNFLKFCADIEVNKRGGSAESMNIIEEKILSRYKEANPDFIKSEAFNDIVNRARKKVEKEPSRLFVHLKEVSDELKLRSTKKKSERKRKSIRSEDDPQEKRSKEETAQSEDSACDSEVKINKRHVEKLERLFHKVYCKVKKLEEKEVNWDKDEENSSYLKWSRYSCRLYRIWEKWQEAKGCLEAVKRLKSNRIAYAGIVLKGTPYPKLNQVIENFVNKTQKFPDFHDILKLTTETLNQNKKVNSDELHRIAASAFQSLGNQLQKCRVFDFWNSFLTYLPPKTENAADPAESDETLAKTLQENQKKSENKLKEVLDKYVDVQITQKLEPEEVPPDADDENYDSAEEEGQEESEEEQEDPEDIIVVSSSSNESEEEGTNNAMQKPNLCENGDGEESTDIDVDDTNKVSKEVDVVKEEKIDSVVEDSVLTTVEKELKMEEIGSIASCSFVVTKSKVEDSDDDIVEISD